MFSTFSVKIFYIINSNILLSLIIFFLEFILIIIIFISFIKTNINDRIYINISSLSYINLNISLNLFCFIFALFFSPI